MTRDRVSWGKGKVFIAIRNKQTKIPIALLTFNPKLPSFCFFFRPSLLSSSFLHTSYCSGWSDRHKDCLGV